MWPIHNILERPGSIHPLGASLNTLRSCGAAGHGNDICCKVGHVPKPEAFFSLIIVTATIDLVKT